MIRGLERLRPTGDFALHLAFSFDWRVFSYVAGIALLAGIVAGLAPALRISRTNLNDTLREGGRGLVADTRRHWLRSGLGDGAGGRLTDCACRRRPVHA